MYPQLYSSSNMYVALLVCFVSQKDVGLAQVASGNIVSIHTLEKGKRYPVTRSAPGNDVWAVGVYTTRHRLPRKCQDFSSQAIHLHI
jgi:predicted amino acid racemase